MAKLLRQKNAKRSRKTETDMDSDMGKVIIRGDGKQDKLILMPRTMYEDWGWNKPVLMDQRFEKIDTPELLGTQLMDHQRTIVRAMIDLEDIRYITLEDKTTTVETSAGVLTEKFGSGKTMMIISLIMHGAPKAYPEVMVLKDEDGNPFQSQRVFKEVLKPNIVFVGAAVVNQWVKEINRYAPHLKVFKVENVFHLRTLRDLIATRQINNYDVIVSKNGVVTGACDFPELGEALRNRTVKPIINVISHIVQDCCFSRVILDDFDTIQLPSYAENISALFTWFVSATRKHVKNIVNVTRADIKYVSDVLQRSKFNYNQILNNSLLFHYFKVQNKSRYTDESICAGKPKFWRYRFVNPNAAYINLIGALEGADHIMEMINADAIETAAAEAGIQTNKVSDIFQKLLGEKYQTYQWCNEILDFLDECIELLEDEDNPLLPAPEGETYGKRAIYRHELPQWKYPGLLRLLTEVEEETMTKKDVACAAIDRVKTNLEQGVCDICVQPFGDAGVVIFPCCTGIFCHKCTMTQSHWYRSQNRITGKCQKCRAQVGFDKLIYLNLEMNLDNIMDEVFSDDESSEEEIVEEMDTEPTEEELFKRGRVDGLTKMEVMIDIINGVDRYMHKKQANIKIPSLIEGTREMPPPTHRKVLIFADQSETLGNIRKKLTESGVKFLNLEGRVSELTNIVERYKKIPNPDDPNCDAVDVLLVQAAKYCSGLNLQFTSDLIFFHRIIDTAIEAQIAGRIQRIGRTCEFNFHYLLYENEDRDMFV